MQTRTCSSDGPHPAKDHPFCPECGALSPVYAAPGPFAVELEEIASEQIRSAVVANVTSWFPQVNPLEIDGRLKSGPSILLKGVDEDSARRVIEYLKAFKAPGRMVDPKALDSWPHNVWNPGLAVAAVALIAALAVGGLTGALFVVAGVGAVAVGAFLKGKKSQPVISSLRTSGNDEMRSLAANYAAVIGRLSPEDREMVKSITTGVFGLRRRLTSDSVAAIAAGGQAGDLFDRLTDSIRTALEIGHAILSSTEEERQRLREELNELKDLVARTEQWLRTAEEERAKPAAELSRDLDQVTRRIDRILETVRTPASRSSQPGTVSARPSSTTEPRE